MEIDLRLPPCHCPLQNRFSSLGHVISRTSQLNDNHKMPNDRQGSFVPTRSDMQFVFVTIT